MRPSICRSSPMISILSPCPAASTRSQDVLEKVFGLQRIQDDMLAAEVNDNSEDDLNRKFQKSWFSRTWHSTLSQCPSSGSILHWLAPNKEEGRRQKFSLLGITSVRDTSYVEAVSDIRQQLSLNVDPFMMGLKDMVGRPLSPQILLGTSCLPILELPKSQEGDYYGVRKIGLKEITIPAFEGATYADGSSLLSRFSESGCRRPVTGLYEWPDAASVSFRPLPCAKTDHRDDGNSIVLTFHMADDDVVPVENKRKVVLSLSKEIQEGVREVDAKIAKIGFNGGASGQFMIQHDDLGGIEVRSCRSTKPTSMFAESQGAVLASSLDELQSTNSMLQSPEDVGIEDARVGVADCWVEFRATVKTPKGFFKKENGPKVSPAPPSPSD